MSKKLKGIDLFTMKIDNNNRLGVDFTDEGKEWFEHYNVDKSFTEPLMWRLAMAMTDKKDAGKEFTDKFRKCFMTIWVCLADDDNLELTYMDGPGPRDVMLQQRHREKYYDVRQNYLMQIADLIKQMEQDIRPYWDEMVKFLNEHPEYKE